MAHRDAEVTDGEGSALEGRLEGRELSAVSNSQLSRHECEELANRTSAPTELVRSTDDDGIRDIFATLATEIDRQNPDGGRYPCPIDPTPHPGFGRTADGVNSFARPSKRRRRSSS